MSNSRAARPSLVSRLAIASIIAILATAFCFIHARHWGFRPGDFNLAWFGARALLNGANPYHLVGLGRVYDWPWPELYPATAMVAALPFAPLSRVNAMLAFVFVGSGLLALGVTRDGWYRLPIFLSACFFVATAASQWSPVLTAGFVLAPAATVFAAKPNIGLAMLLSISSRTTLRYAVIGGVVLTAIGLVLLPSWPIDWLRTMQLAQHMTAPVLKPGGFLILVALSRWRRPEARLLVALACVPQTPSWYEALPVLLVASTYRENLILALLSWVGFGIEQFIMQAANELDYNRQVAMLMIALIYLPATWMVLRRPNEGELPAWVGSLRRSRSASDE